MSKITGAPGRARPRWVRFPALFLGTALLLALAAVAWMSAGPGGTRSAAAVPIFATLSTAAGDGQVVVDVGAYGDFGYETFDESGGQGDPGDAMYDPVGPTGPSTTSWESALHLRRPDIFLGFVTTGLIGSANPQGGLPDPGFTNTTATTASSSFSVGDLDVDLEQSVSDLFTGSTRTGSVLTQVYTMTNVESRVLDFEVIRYYEGDLGFGFGAVVPDGGGHLTAASGTEIVFETDVAGSSDTAVDFVGITAEGGTIPSSARYEVNEWSDFPERIRQGLPLADVVFGDGGDADEFVDAGNDYDVGIALSNLFENLAPAGTVVYTTKTIFGSGVPSDVNEQQQAPTPTPTPVLSPTATATPTPGAGALPPTGGVPASASGRMLAVFLIAVGVVGLTGAAGVIARNRRRV